MEIWLTQDHLQGIEAHGETTYPNEGAGFMLGKRTDETIIVEVILPLDNQREAEAQHNRYELNPMDFDRAENEADKQGLSLVGVFHSHPDHPAEPSIFDRDHAWPNFSYLITAVDKGQARITRAWQLRPDRTAFDEDQIVTVQSTSAAGRETLS